MIRLKLSEEKKGMADLTVDGWLKGMFHYDGCKIEEFHGSIDHCLYVMLSFHGQPVTHLWVDTIKILGKGGG